MSSKYIRRPFATGNTDVPVLAVPQLRGTVMKSSTSEFDGLSDVATTAMELAIQTEDAGTGDGVTALFSTSASMTQVLSDINTALAGFATAEEVEGCVVLKSAGSGEGAFVRVVPPVSGYADASGALGFEVHPHPFATAYAGDLLDAPTRPRQQVNPAGTKFIAVGEERVGSAYNRALHMVSQNADILYSQLRRSVARLVRLTVDETEHAALVTTRSDGSISQVDLSDLSLLDDTIASDARICVGGTAGLSRVSTLREISELFQVTDSEMKEIPAGDRTARVSAVTRGARSSTNTPTFADDTSPPASPVGDTTAISPDGLNALGVNRVKHAGVAISEVRQRTCIACAGATFETNGVTTGDVAVISGSAATSPFNHDGTYLVETVVSEEILVLRPPDDTTTARELNPTEGGSFGTVVVYSGGEWERGLAVTFYPPIPRFPADGKIVITVPVEAALGDVSLAEIVSGNIRTGNNVDGWTLLNLWKNLSVDGAYQGMGGARGGGFYGKVTHRPLRLDKAATGTLSAGTTERSSTGTATLDTHALRLSAAAGDRFDASDVGRTILLTAGPFLVDEPWTIVRLVDNATVELAPPLFRSGYQSADGITVSVTSWTLTDGDAIDIHGMLHLVSPEYFGEDDEAPAPGGFVFSREQRDQGTTGAPTPGLYSFLHLERIRLHADGTNITITTSAPVSADDVIPLAFAPEGTSNIFGESYETKTVTEHLATTFVRVLNGRNAGLYRVKDLRDASVSGNAVTVRNLDGSAVVFTAETEMQVCFYNAKFGASVPVAGSKRAALVLFEDAHETGTDAGYALGVGWRGEGGGIYAYLNDPEFKAFDTGDGASGYAVEVHAHAPAHGFYFDVHGASTGSVERRSVQGGLIVFEAYDLDMSLASDVMDYIDTDVGTVMSAWGMRTHVAGYGPGLLVTRSLERGIDDPLGFTSSAAVVISDDGPTTGIWGGIDMAGSIYARTLTGTGYESGDSGIYSERGIGAGVFVHPFYPHGLLLPDQFLGLGFDYDSETVFGTELGAAGQMFPVSAVDPDVPATTSSPDFSTFPMPHVGVVTIAGADGTVFASCTSRFVQKVVAVSGTATRDAQYLIVAVDYDADADTVKFAVSLAGSSAWSGNEAATAVRVLAKRWYRSHLDIADWFQVGTQFFDQDERYLTPIVTIGPSLVDAVARVAEISMDITAQLDTEGALTAIPFYPNADGEGVGLRIVLDDMPNLDVEPGSFTQEWDGGVWKTGWALDAEQPCAPFPNVGVIAGGEDIPLVGHGLTASRPGSLVVDDVALEVVEQNTDDGPIVYWDNDYSGCLRVGTHPDNLADAFAEDTARIWLRGVRGLPTAAYALRATAIVQSAAGEVKTYVLALRTDADPHVEIATHSVAVTSDGTPREISHDFTEFTLSHAAYDALSAGAGDGWGVHLTLDVPGIGNDTSESDEGGAVRLLSMRLEQISRPARTYGNQEVVGALRANTFRHTSPVRGFCTVAPFQAEFLNPVDFGKVIGHSTANAASYAYMQQEGHGVGLLQEPGGDFMMPTFDMGTFFRKGPHAAAIVAYHPYFDPLWYVQGADTVNSSAIYADAYPDVDEFVLPRRTGFMVPLDPPHGSRLTTLHVGVSFRPSYRRSAIAGSTVAAFHVYRDLPFADTEIRASLADWYDVDAWTAKSGVLIRLWRSNALNFGVDMESTCPGEITPDHGYAELLHEEEVDLSAVTPPSFDSNPASSSAQAGAGHGLGDEHFHTCVVDLYGVLGFTPGAAIVDRRQYNYFLTVEFYAGPRQLLDDPTGILNGSGMSEIWWYPDDGGGALETQHIPLEVDSSGGSTLGSNTQHRFVGLIVPYPLDDESLTLPPIVKFRGARLGWVTDRPGHGGWG